MRTFATMLALLGACTFGLNLPAHAENAAKERKPAQTQTALDPKIEAYKKRITEKLNQLAEQKVKITDVKGNAVNPQEMFANPAAYKDGMILEIGEHKVEIRGELLENGEKGLKFYLTHMVNNNRVDGQVITVNPGATKREIQKRFEDAIESFMMNKESFAAKKGDDKRGVASESDLTLGRLFICGITYLLMGLTIHFTITGVRGMGNGYPIAGLAIILLGAFFGSYTPGWGKACFAD